MSTSPRPETTLIDSTEWLLLSAIQGEASVRLLLLDQDIQSAQIALDDYERIRASIGILPNLEVLPRVVHHAKTFVCAMRRIGRLLESMPTSRDQVPEAVGAAIKLAWRSRKAMLTSYIEPRNCIEHIDNELSGKSKWILMNLHGDRLLAKEGAAADVSRSNLESVIAARARIIEALRNDPHRPRRRWPA